MNPGILSVFGKEPAMPFGLLGRPTPIPTIHPRFGFNISSIPSMALWFDATDSSTLTVTDGVVSEWKSKFGNITATQAAGNRPSFVNNGINGRPSLLFNGSTSRLTTTYNASNLTGFVTYAAVVQLAAIPIANTYWPVIIARSGGTASALNINSNSIPPRWTITHRTGVFDSTQGAPVAIFSQRIVATIDSSGFRIRVNGISGRRYISLTAGSGLSSALFVIGYDSTAGNRYLYGSVGEILMWSRSLTEIEIENVDTYLASKWAVGI